jgi:hypothetical protein
MTATKARVTPVRQFQENHPGVRPRRHVLAIYDTGQVRALIDRGERMATRLLAILNDGQEHECLDGPPQIQALCDDYVRQYTRMGGPLACRLTREHLTPVRRHRTVLAQPSEADRQPAVADSPAPASQPATPAEEADDQGLAFAA